MIVSADWSSLWVLSSDWLRTEGATHSTSCTEYPGSSSPGPSSCPYSQDNLSWAEYQVTIPMPGEGDPGHASGVDVFTVIMKFDADTTIVSQLCLSTVYINFAVHIWGFNNSGTFHPGKKFNLDFDIQGSCHSNCWPGPPTCSGSTCTVIYKSTSPMQLFNVKKTNPSGENDRSNLISVNINGVEQC